MSAHTIRAVDLFCGAGGSSTGLAQLCAERGWRLDLTAINHWQTAVETHARNHPDARHLCESMENLDPRKVWTSGKRLDVLWASPECVHHSVARGGRP
ncbi:MAG: DNA cytosine methyltransferase, partial [Terriglobales bacterium]